MSRLEIDEFAQERVVLGVGDGRRVELMIVAIGLLELRGAAIAAAKPEV